MQGPVWLLPTFTSFVRFFHLQLLFAAKRSINQLVSPELCLKELLTPVGEQLQMNS